MSALFLAIPLTIFVLFVLPIWLWLHYSNRSSRGELAQSEQQRLAELNQTHSGCVSAFKRWKTSLMLNIQTGGTANGGVNLNKKLWRIPQQGMVKGVCAGIAHYLDVPVKLVRIWWCCPSFWSGLFHLCRLHRTDVCVGSDAGQRGFRRTAAIKR